jgi:hypothetical protein
MGKWKAGELRSTYTNMINMLGEDGLTLRRMATWCGAGLGGAALAVHALEALSAWSFAKMNFEAIALATGTGAGMGAAGVVGVAMGMALAEMHSKKMDLKSWRDSRAPCEQPSSPRKDPFDTGCK